METVEKPFAKTTPNIIIRPFTNDDVDYILSRHVELYKIEYGLGAESWKNYIIDGVNQFLDQFDPEKDCLYILDADNHASGCIAVTHMNGEETAQLRFFLIEPTVRGLGAGNQLVEMAIQFCDEKKYKHLFLWTFDKLAAARHIYHKNGFRMTETYENDEWGQPVLVERWDLFLR